MRREFVEKHACLQRHMSRAWVETYNRSLGTAPTSGKKEDLKAALAPDFTDHTLPPGRAQGPEGPAFKSLRAAVPDLGVETRKMVVAGPYVTVHMEFKGHFTGSFGSAKGQGQTVDFIATDLLKMTDGRIADNWHIEDNLTLLKQMGVAKVGP